MANALASHLPSDHQQQVSFHFWKCQLTEASPKYSWDPENWANAAKTAGDKGERSHLRRHGDGENTDKKESKSTENGGSNGHPNGNSNGSSNGEKSAETNGNGAHTGAHAGAPDADENGEEAAIDADYMQHVLKVNACILGARATGVHLISVRTKCYQSEQPDTCPIVCIDPASQRTLTLGYEFVLDSQNEVTFELTEGTGPVWLTGLHQVRVHDDEDQGDGEGDAELEDVDDSMRDIEEEEGEEEDDGEEDEEEEDEEEEDEEEEIRPAPKRVARATKSERPVASPKQPQRGRKAPAANKKGGSSAAARDESSSPPTKATKAKATATATAAEAAKGGKKGVAGRKTKA